MKRAVFNILISGYSLLLDAPELTKASHANLWTCHEKYINLKTAFNFPDSKNE
jgi:hypothetical protein